MKIYEMNNPPVFLFLPNMPDSHMVWTAKVPAVSVIYNNLDESLQSCLDFALTRP